MGGGGQLAQPAADFKAIDARQHHVQQDQIPRMVLGRLERHLAIQHGPHFIARSFEIGLGDLAGYLTVIDDENSCGHRCFLGPLTR